MQTSKAGSLKEKLKEKLKEDRLQHQELMSEQLHKLMESLKKSADEELNTIEADIQNHSKAIAEHLDQLSCSMEKLNRQRIKPIYAMILTPLLTLAITCGAAWGLMQYYTQKIENLSMEIRVAETVLAKLESHGAKIQISSCTDREKESRLCVKIDRGLERYGDKDELWMIPEGY